MSVKAVSPLISPTVSTTPLSLRSSYHDLTSTTSSLRRTSASETGVSCQMMTAITAIRTTVPQVRLLRISLPKLLRGRRSFSLSCSLSCSIVLVEEDRSP